MKEEELIQRLAGRYPDAEIRVTGADCNFEVQVVSEAFAGLNTLQRQRPILQLFKEELASGALHALTVRARTPQELAGHGE